MTLWCENMDTVREEKIKLLQDDQIKEMELRLNETDWFIGEKVHTTTYLEERGASW